VFAVAPAKQGDIKRVAKNPRNKGRYREPHVFEVVLKLIEDRYIAAKGLPKVDIPKAVGKNE
jgi:hypothetical protein